MFIGKKYFRSQQFEDVKGYNSGVGLFGPPLMTVWCYSVEGVLIDTGMRHLRPAILERIRQDKPALMLITHYHEDHSANAGAIRKISGIPGYGHPLTVRKLSAPFKILPYQYLIWGRSEPVDLSVHEPVIDTGKCRFRPIHTPGHSKDHTVYLEEKSGRLFSGDLFLGERIKYFRADENLADQIHSLERILSYDFDALFCAHRPLMQGGREAIRRKLDFLVNFSGTVQDLKSRGMSLKAVIRRLDDRSDRFVKYLTLNNACFANMVRSAYEKGSGQ
jgi:glyoxylase-like metal-dependent hydrolase (beta-lactamase superfamily II)